MATQELLIRHTTPGSRVLRRGGDRTGRSMSGGLQLALVGVLTFVVCLGLAGLNALSDSASRSSSPYSTSPDR
jgi:hypothetical protein